MNFDRIAERLSDINLYYYMNEAANILKPSQCPHILRLNLVLKHLFSSIRNRIQENGFDGICAIMLENYTIQCSLKYTLK